MTLRTASIACLLAICLPLLGCTGSEPAAITAVAQAETARIGVMTGTTGEEFAVRRFARADVQRFDDVMDAVAALKAGQVDAVLTSLPTVVQVVKHNADLQYLPERLINEDTVVALRKGQPELLRQLDAALTDLEQDGTLADMRRRWFKTDLLPYEVPAMTGVGPGEPLRIGVSATREPMSFIDAAGQVSGHDGELARRLGAALGRPVEFQDMKFAALIPSLQAGKIDLVVTGMSATPERRKSVDFSRPYFANAQVLLVRKAAPVAADAPAAAPGFASAADVNALRIGVLLGSAHEAFVTREWPQATVLTYQTTPDVVLAVRTNKVDAAISDTDPLRQVLAETPDLAMFGPPVLQFDLGVGFSKQSSALRARFNDFLVRLEADGTLPDMRKRWIEAGSRQMPELPSPPAGEPLVVGTAAEGLPFEAVVDNQLVGFDIELVERFGREIGRPVQWQNMVFGSLVAGVASGKVDAIAASIFVTAERQKLIDFSNAYYVATSSLFARRERVAANAAPTAAPASGPATPAPPSPGWLQQLGQSFQSNIIAENRYLLIWEGLKVTVLLSILSTLFGTALGALVCFLRMSRNAWMQWPARVYIAVLRGTPVLVLLMMIFYVAFASVDISPILVAVIAFGMNFAAYAAEIFRSGIEGIDKGQTEAGIAMGFSRVQTFLHVVMPQTLQRILPVYKGEFISLVKMTSIVGYIAVQDLTKASDIIRSRTFDAFFPLVMVAVLYFLISWLLLQGLEYLERRTDPKARRARAVRS